MLALCLAVGAAGSVATAPNIHGWYEALAKPWWNPPSGLFGPVWTFLYVCMAVAAWLVWRKKNAPGRIAALKLFALQLTLNAAWPWIFFHFKAPDAALAEILLLWLAVAATTAYFAKVSKPAAWLFVPYILWLTFAAALNFSFWRLNPDAARTPDKPAQAVFAKVK